MSNEIKCSVCEEGVLREGNGYAKRVLVCDSCPARFVLKVYPEW